MKFFNKSSFLSIFLLVFSLTLVVLGSLQAIFGTLRWYNASEQSHEQLQNYPIYSASEPTQTGAIHVFIAPKPTTAESNVYVFLQNTASLREEALATVTPEKAQIITQKVQILEEKTAPVVVPETQQLLFQSPVDVRIVPESSSMPRGYSSTIDTVLTGTYFSDVLWSFPLTVDINRTSPRGQMSNESVTLSGRIQSLSEMAKVLVHELGHMVDIYYLRSRGTKADPSKTFYTISWTEPTVLRSSMTSSSFVSGYAATNQYEDFAETFAMYVFHNTTLVERAQNSPALQQKYDFLRDSVFGSYFIGTNYEQNPVPSSLWDVTKIVIKAEALREIFVQLRSVFSTLS
jgi:hypothetical protein